MKDYSKSLAGANSKAIRVRIPASVAYDLRKMNKITESVLGKLGCPGCHSGFDIRFDIERVFVFDEQLQQINAGF